MKILITTKEDHKKLKWMIYGLLKSGAVSKIKRVNNIASYEILDWKVIKEQEKCFVLECDNKDKVFWIIKKMWCNFEEFDF